MSIFNKLGKIKKTTIFKSALIVCIATVIVTVSVFSVAALNEDYTIKVDSKTIQTSSFSDDKHHILKTENISINDGDTVKINKDNNTITVKRAFDVIVHNNETAVEISTTGCTVEEAIKKANLTVSKSETTVPALDSKITKATKVKIVPLVNISIKADGKTIKEEVPQLKVSEILDMYKIVLDVNDTVNYDLGALIDNETVIEVDRIEHKVAVKEKVVKHDVKKTKTDDLYVGETKVVKKGKNGKKEVKIIETYVNGKLTKEEVYSQKTLKKSVTEKILVGTKKKPQPKPFASSPQIKPAPASGTANSGQHGIPVKVSNGVLYDANGKVVPHTGTLTGSGTAYYAPPGALTATGVKAYYGGVAVNPNVIPYGTKMFVVSTDGFVYGYATAVDTGGALMSGSAVVDCYYPTYDECVVFGRRNMIVYILG